MAGVITHRAMTRHETNETMDILQEDAATPGGSHEDGNDTTEAEQELRTPESKRKTSATGLSTTPTTEKSINTRRTEIYIQGDVEYGVTAEAAAEAVIA